MDRLSASEPDCLLLNLVCVGSNPGVIEIYIYIYIDTHIKSIDTILIKKGDGEKS